MTVYVDEMQPCRPNKNWRWREACHMFADTPEELHALALRIGLRREWYQTPEKKTLGHYDLTRSMRRKAIKAGAVSCDIEVTAKYFCKAYEDLDRS